jgi:HNH endonuclease/AP2 domain
MHRAILGAQPGQMVDHRNHDTLDNRRENLRFCSYSENAQNSRKHSNNTSGFKGVSWYARSNRWVAYINLNGKRIHIGYVRDKDEAILARDAAVKCAYGEFGVLNFIYKPLSELTDGLPPVAEL